ncbi:major facilitator superfamily transporter [Pyrenophora seminiperda CCB06]|uniref:Major facilitator superfamily transporter n=1 Tax=Pyrenophora seminiperda CCB06 TaxID=1302712 RepID=A0A3M7M1K6_9PLEO|nr:major facilitator superfamily transporter [Pyrenophora seminiperda CCB06]
MFGGMLITVRTMISEISTPKTQARAFAYFSFAGNMGIMLGPTIGGVFAAPAKEYPKVFGGIDFFKHYPYALATFVGGFAAIITSILCAVYIKETLPSANCAIDPQLPTKRQSPHLSAWKLLQDRGILIVIFVHNYAYFLGNACSATLPVYFFTPVDKGGFGFSPFQISVYFCIAGAAQAVWQLVAFPYLQHRLGTVWVIQVSAMCWPIYFVVYPVGNILLRNHLETIFWPSGIILVILLSGIAMSYTAVQLALNDISPSPTSLSTLNALALMGTSGLRAVSPGAFSSLVAVGIRGHIMQGQLIWAVLLPLGITFAMITRYLP